MSKGDLKRSIDKMYAYNCIERGRIKTCLLAPNIHFCSLLINPNGKNFLDVKRCL